MKNHRYEVRTKTSPIAPVVTYPAATKQDAELLFSVAKEDKTLWSFELIDLVKKRTANHS